MKTKQLIITALVVMMATTATAQKKWNFEFGVGASDNSGNVDNFSLKNNSSVSYEDSTLCFSSSYKFIYQLENGHESNKGINGGLNFDFYKFGNWSTFVAIDLTSNHYKGYDFKSSSLVGAKYYLHSKTDTCEYSISAAIVYDNINYTDEQTNLNKETWRLSLRPKIYQRMGDNLILSHTTFYQPALNDFGDYIINSTTHLENKISKKIYIDLSFNYEYRSKIPNDKYRHYDTATELTLKIKL